LEAVLAAIVLAIGMVALIVAVSRALLLSETNKQIKLALFDIQGIVEEIQGAAFDEIMDPDYPTSQAPIPRFRNGQNVPGVRLYGFKSNYGALLPVYVPASDTYVDPATGLTVAVRDNATGEYVDPGTGQPVANPPHLDSELITVSYGSQVDMADADGDGDTTEALALALAPGAETSTAYKPTAAEPVERFRPANNSPALDEFRTPEPLYVTVEAAWTGPEGRAMQMKITFVRSR
jgi:hypothetical protein